MYHDKSQCTAFLSTIWFIRYIQTYVHSTVYKSARDPAVSIKHANRNMLFCQVVKLMSQHFI